MNFDALSAWAPRALAVLRIMTGLLFLQHGMVKFFGFPMAMPGEGSMPPLILLSALMELIGGPLIALGLLTRPVAFLLSGEMAAAYFMAHAPHSFWPIVNQGEVAILFSFIFLYLFFAGPGAWSVDARLKGTA